MDLSSLLEIEVKEGKASELRDNGEIAAYKNIPDFSIRDIASVRFRKLHCTACDLHIGSAPASAHNMHEHPVLHVLLCTACRNFYGDGTFEQGDDATDMFCRWCANGGNLYCCSYCSNTFCYNCIKRNFDPMVRRKIERDEKWKCFVCNPADLYTARAACWALLQHVQTVTRILQSDTKMSPKEIEDKMNLDESQCCPHRSKRKRSETISDDEEQDVTYNLREPKRKRRKLFNAKRKRREIKIETQEHPSRASTNYRRAERKKRRDDKVRYVDVPAIRATKDSTNDKTSRRRQENVATVPPAVIDNARKIRVELPILPKFPITDDDIPPTLLECDQTMIEGAESLSFDVTANVEPPPRNISINPVPMANLMKVPSPPSILTKSPRTHRLVRGTDGTPVLVRKIQTSTTMNNNGKSTPSVQSLPMVTIPSLNHAQSLPRNSLVRRTSRDDEDCRNSASPTITSKRSRASSARSTAKSTATILSSNDKNRTSLTPSVIDLDSDSDDPVLVESRTRERPPGNNGEDRPLSSLSTVTRPIRPDDGLMTIIAASSDVTENNRVRCDRDKDETIDETGRQSDLAINSVLETLKRKFKRIMDTASLFSQDKDSTAAKNRARAVHRTIKRTVAELNSFNDNLVRAYRDYKRARAKNDAKRTRLVRLDDERRSSRLIPLDMECTRESEPELNENISDDDEDNDNDDSLIFQPTREIRPNRRKVNRSVEAKPSTKNKSVQAYDCRARDYDKSIGYALLLRADYDPKRQRDVLRPVMLPDPHFGNYEEEFINYLQRIEDEGTMVNEDFDEDRDETTINELVEADISAIIDGLTSVDDDENLVAGKDHLTDENIEILEEHVEIITTKSMTSDETSSSEASNSDEESRTNSTLGNNEISARVRKNARVDTSLEANDAKNTSLEKENESKKIDSANDEVPSNEDNGRRERKTVDEETVLAVRALIEEDDSEDKSDILTSWKSLDSDDECTILD